MLGAPSEERGERGGHEVEHVEEENEHEEEEEHGPGRMHWGETCARSRSEIFSIQICHRSKSYRDGDEWPTRFKVSIERGLCDVSSFFSFLGGGGESRAVQDLLCPVEALRVGGPVR